MESVPGPLLELVLAVSGNKESLLRQVKQLNAWLLLKGFELCSSSPKVHPPPAMCLLISVSQQVAALLWEKAFVTSWKSYRPCFWCQAGVLEGSEPFPWPALAPEPRWLSLVLAASQGLIGTPQFICKTAELLVLALALAEGLWVLCLSHCSLSGALLEPEAAPVPSS